MGKEKTHTPGKVSDEKKVVKVEATSNKKVVKVEATSNKKVDSDGKKLRHVVDGVRKRRAKLVGADAPGYSNPELKNAVVTSAISANIENRILVSGLPFSATSEEVERFFISCGVIDEIILPLKKGTDHPSGLAFVKFSNRSELENALQLNGSAWPNSERWIKIVEAMDRKATAINKSSTEIKVRPDGCDTVFVGNLSDEVNEELIQGLFSSAGEISKIRLPVNDNGKAKGFCHVTYSDGSNTNEAIKLNNSTLGGRLIRVDYAPPRLKEGAGRARDGTKGGQGKGGRGFKKTSTSKGSRR